MTHRLQCTAYHGLNCVCESRATASRFAGAFACDISTAGPLDNLHCPLTLTCWSQDQRMQRLCTAIQGGACAKAGIILPRASVIGFPHRVVQPREVESLSSGIRKRQA